MPDWNNKNFIHLKKLIEDYILSLNNQNFELLNKYLSHSVIISRGKTVEGKEKVINLFRDLFGKKVLENVKFELVDTSACFFNDNEAQIILFTETFQNNKKKETFIETLNLIKENDKEWKIHRIFGLSYEPEFHRKYFKPFLSK